ncbi:MAG: HD-GYP domain-containing protein [Pirellula sp.]
MMTPASISRQCDDLAQLLGTDCLPYIESASGSLPLPSGAGGMETRQVARLACSTKRESVLCLDANRILFAVPLVSPPLHDWVAIGCLLSCISSAQKILQLAALAVQRGTQIETHNHQLLRVEDDLNRSFREREWLRQLNSQRAIRKRSIGQQSRQSMESLRTMIGAEAIAIFLYHDINLENYGLEPVTVGRSIWTMEDIRALMPRIQKPMAGDATILNQVSIALPSATVHSCIVVPIGETEPIGFVVAINHRKSVHTGDVTESGFHAGDAELLHELAEYLLSDGNSNVLIHESEQLVLGTLRAMSNAIEARDPYTHGHSERVAHVGYEIAIRLQLSAAACQEIYLAGILHDIGKIGIPDQVLMKPGKLTPEEVVIIQRHPEIGHKILEELGKLKFALPGVLYHHERIDGAGYPHRLAGDEIPLMARILAVSDAFDAMSSSRVYRTALGQDRAVEILKQGAGTQWDVDAVKVCLDYIAEQELLHCGTIDRKPRTRVDDWRQVSQAL